MLKLKGKVSKTGTSQCVILVKSILEMYGLQDKDELILELREEGILIKKVGRLEDGSMFITK